jgi:hypothetical protein
MGPGTRGLFCRPLALAMRRRPCRAILGSGRGSVEGRRGPVLIAAKPVVGIGHDNEMKDVCYRLSDIAL